MFATKKEPLSDIKHEVYDYSFNMCRICLKPGEISIFGEHNILSNIVEFGLITISAQDNFPKYLCETCHLLLEAAVLFRRTAKKTDTLLRASVSSKYSESCDSSDMNYVQEVNEIFHNKLKLLNIKSEYQCSVSNESEYTFSQHDIKIDCSQNYDYSAIDELKTEKEYLFVSDTDGENEESLDKTEYNAPKSDIYMIIATGQENKDKEEQFICDICFAKFNAIGKLENHIELEHDIKKTEKVNCVVCNEVVSKVLYNNHMKIHREKFKQKKKKDYIKIQCKICNKIVNKTYYKYHLKMHGTEDERAERTRPCTVCNKFISISYYNDHLKRVHKVGPYGEKLEGEFDDCRKLKHIQCPVCDKNIRENKYNDHLVQHEKPPKKYVCEHCSKEFNHRSAFNTHCLTHGGEMKYNCQFCPYKAQHIGLLKVHVRTHTGDYNYKCTKCPARFITKSNLNQHVQRHNGPGSIKCYECDKTFYRKRNMEEHYKTIHLGVKDVICNTCGKGFSHRDRMLSHQLKVHKRERLLPRVPTYLKIANEGMTK